jgi:ABC-type nitrate/sulfonate/bicarbonate transport system permease component
MTQLTQTSSGLVTDDIPVPRRKVAARTGFFSQRSITQVFSIVGGLALWELLARFAVHNTAFLAPPSLVAIRFYQMLRDGSLLFNGWVSFQELIGGFVLGVAAGIIIGAAMVQWKQVDDALEVWIAALYAAPIVALAPILIIWFGFGPWSKVAVVFIMVVFPMVICTQAGLESVDRRLLLVARSFCGSRWKTFLTVALPSAAPFIVSGMRQSVGRGLVGVVIGELFGAKAGLGNIITTASSVFDMPTLFVAVVTLALAGIILTGILRSFELRLAAWRDVA